MLDTVNTVVTQTDNFPTLVGLIVIGEAAQIVQQAHMCVHKHTDRLTEDCVACCESNKWVRG